MNPRLPLLEEPGRGALKDRTPTGDTVMRLAREAGFHRAGFVDPRLLSPWAERARALRRRGLFDNEALRDLEWDWVFAAERWSLSSSILVCCLSCCRREPDDRSRPGDPHALVAPFARANYYRAAVVMLRGLALRLEQELGIRRKSLRLFANSRIPEKPLLAASGLGSYGKNGLSLVPGLGSLFVIAGAVIPVPWQSLLATFPAEPPGGAPAPDPCGACERCLRACPTGAIVEPGVVDPGRCLQGLAGAPVHLEPSAMEAWGTRLYGCQVCQEACPHNKGLTEEAPQFRGSLGPSVSVSKLLSLDSAALKAFFHGTAMGMSWVSPDALLRNALITAGNRRDPAVRPEVERFLGNGNPVLRDAARWALERMSRAERAAAGCALPAALRKEGQHDAHRDDHVEKQRSNAGEP